MLALLLLLIAAPDRAPLAPGRAARAGPVCGLRGPHPGPLPAAGVAGPGVARRLPQVRRVRAAPGRDLHMLPARWQGLLQTGLQQVTPSAPALVKNKNKLKPEKAQKPLNPSEFLPNENPTLGRCLPPGAIPTARPLSLTARLRPRRLFGIKCAQCRAAFSSSDLVMRARDHVYHLECFRCAACGRQLLPGDQFCLRERDLLCRADHGPPLDGAAARGPRSPALPPANAAHLTGTGSPPRDGGRVGRQGVCGGRAAALTVHTLPRAGARAATCPAAAGAQGGGEDHPRADGAERKAAAHAADLLRRQPAPRRPDEGAACGDDWAQPSRHPRLVPEQALQGQEKVHPHEAAPAAATQRQDGERPHAPTWGEV